MRSSSRAALAVGLLALSALQCVCAAPQPDQEASPRYIRVQNNQEDNSLNKQQVYYELESSDEAQGSVLQHEQSVDEVTSVGTTTPRPIGITSIVTSVWDLVVSWVRGMLGLQRHDPPRMARAILGAVAGDNRCWDTTACQAGRIMRRIKEKDFIFMMMERVAPSDWKGIVKTMLRASNENNADCYSYNCVGY